MRLSFPFQIVITTGCGCYTTTNLRLSSPHLFHHIWLRTTDFGFNMKWRFIPSVLLLCWILIDGKSTGDGIQINDDPLPAANQNNLAETIPVVSPSAISSVYEGCDNVKDCVGLPSANCIQDKSCSALVTLTRKKERHNLFEFELWAINSPANSFVAVGFSADNLMGDDSVIECSVINGSRVDVYMSRNDANKTNTRLENPISGLNVTEATYLDGNLYCKFERSTQLMSYLLLARGLASRDGISYHGTEKTVSPRPLKPVPLLVQLHGTFMVTVWMLLVPCGILLARHFNSNDGRDQSNGISMMTTWTLTVVAFILIFVELGGWTLIPASHNPHAIIGVITTLLVFIQPIIIYFRPDPESHTEESKRKLFKRAHWAVGTSAHILGIVCLYLAVGLDKAALPNWVTWLLVAYTVFYVHTNNMLSCSALKCWGRSSGPGGIVPFVVCLPCFFLCCTPLIKGNPKMFLFFIILVMASFSIAVIATIANGPWLE